MTRPEEAVSPVVYVTFQAPKYLHARKNRTPLFICECCGKGFASPGRVSQKKAGKVYRRRYCSRSCYEQTIKPKTSKEDQSHEPEREIAE